MKKRFLKRLLTSIDRLSDYGFGKLHQLIEAVPSTIEVAEKGKGVKYLRLKEALPPAKKVYFDFWVPVGSSENQIADWHFSGTDYLHIISVSLTFSLSLIDPLSESFCC